MSEYCVWPADKFANDILLQLVNDPEISASVGEIAIDGEPINVYWVSERNLQKVRDALMRNTDFPKVYFGIRSSTDHFIKHLIRTKKDVLVHIKPAT